MFSSYSRCTRQTDDRRQTDRHTIPLLTGRDIKFSREIVAYEVSYMLKISEPIIMPPRGIKR